MKKLLLPLFFLGCTIAVFAQDKTIELDRFTEIDAATSVFIELIKSNEHKAEVWIKEGDIDELQVEVIGNTLRVKWKDRGKLWRGDNWKRQAELKVFFKTIDDIDVSAGAQIECDDVIKAEDIDINASSGGRIDIEVKASVVDANVSSGGMANIEGTTDKLVVTANSGGGFGGKELEAGDVKANASSGGNAKVWATKSIKAKANSGGNVRYRGNPSQKDIESSKWSGGSVRNI